MTPEQRAIQKEITAALDTLPRHVRAGLDKDRAALEALGAW